MVGTTTDEGKTVNECVRFTMEKFGLPFSIDLWQYLSMPESQGFLSIDPIALAAYEV